ncbi:MAG: hypothetical protein ATN35_07695 [Epulopiscium sp. Nele67-Bin004]|nr:MAG: hypothetical protein ATN35_07695 [Epulopiscium sp. Nele67-Bin004]
MKKNNKPQIPKTIVAISIIVLASTTVKGFQINVSINNLEKKIQDTQDEIYENQQDLLELKETEKTIGTLEYIESIARDQLGMVKPDDIVFKEK